MMNDIIGDMSFNRFVNLDSIEERIINHFVTSQTDNANRICKLLKYSDTKALLKPSLTLKEKAELVDMDSSNQEEKRFFRSPFIEDAMTVQCSLIRIYIDSIVPKNHLNSIVNVGFDIVTHNKIVNVYNDACDDIENPEQFRPIEQQVMMKSRNSVILKNLLAELNGLEIAGVGKFQFNQQLSPFSQARLGIFNNKNYMGYKVVVPVMMSGVS